MGVTVTHKPSPTPDYFHVLDRMTVMRYATEALRRREQYLASHHNSDLVLKPRMDLCDDKESPKITAVLELPGVKKEQISLHIQDGKLFVSGERRSPLPSDPAQLAAKYPFREVKYGRFQRVITLPLGTQPTEVSASLAEGMLTVSWPRTSAAEPCRIEVE